MIEVKVVKVPSVVKTVALDDGATVEEALSTANVDIPDNHQVTVNGEKVDVDTTLNNCDKIIITKSAKGNI